SPRGYRFEAPSDSQPRRVNVNADWYEVAQFPSVQRKSGSLRRLVIRQYASGRGKTGMHPTRTVRALVLKPSVRQLDCPIVIEREAGIPGHFPQVPVGVSEVPRIPPPECLKSGPHNLSST